MTLLGSPTLDMDSPVQGLPGILANCRDQYDLLRAIRTIDAYCATLSAIRTIHAQNLCRVADHLQSGEPDWGHKSSLEHVFND